MQDTEQPECTAAGYTRVLLPLCAGTGIALVADLATDADAVLSVLFWTLFA